MGSTRTVSARRGLASSLLVAAVLLVLPTHAAAQNADACTPFEHAQTYSARRGFYRAPAWHYGRTVTIVYRADACTSVNARSGAVQERLDGTATVYAGTSASGAAIDERPFTSVEERRPPLPSGETAWWACDRSTVSYSWTIEGVYRFTARGTNGTWTYRHVSLGEHPRSHRHSFSACATT